MKLTHYNLPAFIQDFPPNSSRYQALVDRWTINVTAWIAQAMPPAPSYFYAPLSTDIPSGTQTALVEWVAFPGRLNQYYSQSPPVAPQNPYGLTQDQVYQLADTGFYSSGSKQMSFQTIPATLCPQANWQGTLKTFGPYGPRGWLDEYCEWSVARDGSGNIVRVDFACENPEYWTSLWKVSMERVRELYEETLNFQAPASRQIKVALGDLVLTGPNGTVIDPETGYPAYNPLNKWNSGPVAERRSGQTFHGGAMHLTSTPNTLQTELGLAGGSTPQFSSGNSDTQKLICCGQYGQEYRNSDPHIGQQVNQVVGGQFTGSPQLACLADPVGLYIQTPDFSGFSFAQGVQQQLPSGAQASDIWQVVRGSATVNDPVTGQPFPGQMILHAVAQVPPRWLAVRPQTTLTDILINGQPIKWAGQIASQMKIGLYARPLAAPKPAPPVPCVGAAPIGGPLQCMYRELWDGYYPVNEPCPTGARMSLASNTTFVVAQLPANGQRQVLVLTCNNPPSTPTVAVLRGDGVTVDTTIKVTVQKTQPVTYAVPGNSYPGTYLAVYLDVVIPQGAPSGLRAMQVSGSGMPTQSLPGAIYIKS